MAHGAVFQDTFYYSNHSSRHCILLLQEDDERAIQELQKEAQEARKAAGNDEFA